MKNPAILLVLIIWVRVDAAPAEYTYSCWLNGWRKNTNDRSADVFGIETSHYGFTLDIADFRKAGLGQLNNPAGYEQALEHKADKLRQLPPAELLIELEVDGVRYWANGYRALIVRQYKVVAGSRTYTNPTLSVSVYKTDPTSLDIALLPPVDVRQFHEGDRIELDLELITLPREADDYYGPNESFRKHLAENPNSWKTTYREAKCNNLNLAVSGGRVLQEYPIVIQVEKPEVAVTLRGGVGAVPISFEGLESHKEYRLYQVTDGKRTRFDQSVHGNDFWQTDYDAAKASYAMTFNLPLDGLGESEWIFVRQTERDFR